MQKLVISLGTGIFAAYVTSSQELYSDLLTPLGCKDVPEDVFKVVDAEDNVWISNLGNFAL